jgi:hypothetical protein
VEQQEAEDIASDSDTQTMISTLAIPSTVLHIFSHRKQQQQQQTTMKKLPLPPSKNQTRPAKADRCSFLGCATAEHHTMPPMNTNIAEKKQTHSQTR